VLSPPGVRHRTTIVSNADAVEAFNKRDAE